MDRTMDRERLRHVLSTWTSRPGTVASNVVRRVVTQLIEDRGVDGYALVREVEGAPPLVGWTSLHEAAATCPWRQPSPLPPDQLIEAIWAPVASPLKATVQLLKRQCVGVFTAELGGRWWLFYLVIRPTDAERRLSLDVFAGGAPATGRDFSEAASTLRWTLPPRVEPLYAIHDGFGEAFVDKEVRFNTGSAVLPVREMEPITAYGFARTMEGEPILIDECLLSFFITDVGDRHCFYRFGDHRAKTCFWDHETRWASMDGAPLAVVNRLMRAVLAGRSAG